MTSKVRVLVFDLGGVLINWDGIEPLIALSGGRLSREQARLFWMNTPHAARLDKGECTPLEFSATMADALQLDLTPEAMQAQLRSWNRGPFADSHALLTHLRSRFPLALLSNINPLHWQQVSEEFGLLPLFDHQFASFQLGMRKPEPQIYQHVQETLGVAADEIAFFDDNIECVVAAREAGWTAFQTIGPEQLKATLQEQGWL